VSVKRALHVAAATIVTGESGCGPSDLAHAAYYLLLVPILFLAKIFLEQVVGEAIGMLLGRLLPPWMKTRRALWTGVALMSLLTVVAVAYWNLAGRR
jgi:hypothetical protein